MMILVPREKVCHLILKCYIFKMYLGHIKAQK